MTLKLLYGTLLTLLAVSLPLMGEEAAKTPQPTPELTQQEKLVVTEIMTATIARELAITDPKKTMKNWMTSGAYAKWEKLTAPMFDGDNCPELSDFFSTSLIFVGLQNSETGIVAFYSPWSDTILLCKTDNTTKLQGVENFVFLPGSVFRKDKQAPDDCPQTIIPTKSSLSVALLDTYLRTKDVFLANFSTEKQIAANEFFRSPQEPENLDIIRRNIQTRGVLSLPLKESANLGNRKKLEQIVNALRTSNADEIRLKLKRNSDQKMLDAFLTTPAKLRQELQVFSFLQNKEKCLAALSHPNFTQFVVIISFAQNNTEDISFEFFIFNTAEEVIQAWKANASGGSK